MPQPRSRLWRPLFRLGLGASAGLVVAAVAGWFLGVKPAEVLRYAAGVPAWAILGCAASSFVVLALQSARWHQVMGPLLGLRYAHAYRAQIVGVMFNALLPARGGDLLRVQYLGRRTGKSRATILGTEIVDRWLDWWGWIPTFLVLVAVSEPPSWLFKALGLFGSLLAAWAAAMVMITRAGWTPKPGSRFSAVFDALRTGIAAFRRPRTWLVAFVIAPLPWLWEATVIAWAGRAFGLELTLVQAFSVMIGFNLATIVPSPGGVGTIESGGALALVFFGFDQSRAMAFMFVYHFSQLLPGVAGGAAVLVAEGEKLFGARAEPEAEAGKGVAAPLPEEPPGLAPTVPPA